jgi:hypothetical protein
MVITDTLLDCRDASQTLLGSDWVLSTGFRDSAAKVTAVPGMCTVPSSELLSTGDWQQCLPRESIVKRCITLGTTAWQRR